MVKLYFQHIASFGYIVIGPWAIIYNPADSYKYSFAVVLIIFLFLVLWLMLMFFWYFQKATHTGLIGCSLFWTGRSRTLLQVLRWIDIMPLSLPVMLDLFQIRNMLVFVTTIREISTAGVELRVGTRYEPASLRQPQLWWPCRCGVSQKRML